jgi:hypothetical protein
MKKHPNVEIAPAATIFDYVTENIPEWKLSYHERAPTVIRRLATIATITRTKPPVQAMQDAQRADAKGEYGQGCDNLTDVPKDKIAKLEEFILQAVEKANPK